MGSRAKGARRLMVAALEAEVAAYVVRYRDERDDDGHTLVVRNGAAKPRNVTVGSGTITVESPRVNDKRVVDGKRQKFTSEILPTCTKWSTRRRARKPMPAAEKTWRKLSSPELVALVRAGVRFADGVRTEQTETAAIVKAMITKARNKKRNDYAEKAAA